MKYCTVQAHTYTHAEAVVVVDGRPQGVGRQPVSQNEAQSNHSEMNALEDSQNHNIKHTDTHREWEERDTESKQLLAMLCVCMRECVCVRPSRKEKKKGLGRTAISPDRSALRFIVKVF